MKSSPLPRWLKNGAANWLGFAVQVVIAFFLSPILVHGLGDERNGIWAFVDSILAYLLLMDLGIAASIVRYVARFEAQKDPESLNRVFSTSLFLFGIIGLFTFAIALIGAIPGLIFRTLTPSLQGEASYMLVLLGFNLAMGLPLGVFSSVLDGLECYPCKVTIRIIFQLLRAGLFVGIVRSGGGLIDLAWAITCCSMAENAVMAVAARRLLPGLRFSIRYIDRQTLGAIRNYSLNAFVAMIAGRISFQTDALVIGAFRPASLITYFSIPARLVEYAKNGARAVTAALVPAVSALESRGDWNALKNTVIDATRCVLWLVVPIQAGLMILGRPFLMLWMGPRYGDLCFPTLAILTGPLILAMAQSVAARTLYGMGELKAFARIVMGEAAANVILSIALVKPLGIEGVALGTALPNVVSNLLVVFLVLRRLQVPSLTYICQSWLPPCLAGILLVGGWRLVSQVWVVAGWHRFLLVGTVGCMGYYGIAIGWEWLARKSRAHTGKPGQVYVNIRTAMYCSSNEESGIRHGNESEMLSVGIKEVSPTA